MAEDARKTQGSARGGDPQRFPGGTPPAAAGRGPAFAGLLEEMSLEEVRAFGAKVVVLPLGSTEPHGPHLPYGTDTWQVTGLCRLAVEKANRNGARALLYPALPITNNANLRGFPFALRIGIRTLMSVLADIIAQCAEDGIEKVVLVNGHGGNPGAIHGVLREVAGMDGMPFVCATGVPGAGPLVPQGFRSPIEQPRAIEHAGEYETSLMMHLRPDLVREEKLALFPEGRQDCPALSRAVFVRPWHLYLPAGAGGETRHSSAAKGEAVLRAEAEGLAELIVELSQARFDKQFPYGGQS